MLATAAVATAAVATAATGCGPSAVLDPDASADDAAALDAPIDALEPGTGAYLDRCTGPGDCATLLCVDDVGATRFCSKTCQADNQCADEHFCVGGRCAPDDTGAPCSVASPETCGKGLCLGQGDGNGFCTKECAAAPDCPAGYACTRAGGSTEKICVDIEKPCATANNCGTGLCLSAQGCTAFCQSAADCPPRLAGLPAYTCEIAFGSAQPICVPPADILGPDAIGASCPAAGTNDCRSGACNASANPAPMCTQTCNSESGCGPGLGCFPLVNGADVDLVCNRAGIRDLGEPCSAAADCHSGLCDADGLYCTRLCSDGLCPSDFTCLPAAGTGIAICRR